MDSVRCIVGCELRACSPAWIAIRRPSQARFQLPGEQLPDCCAQGIIARKRANYNCGRFRVSSLCHTVSRTQAVVLPLREKLGDEWLLLRLLLLAIEIAWRAGSQASTCVGAPVHAGEQPALAPPARFQPSAWAHYSLPDILTLPQVRMRFGGILCPDVGLYMCN